MQMQTQKRTTVDIDTRRHVIVAAQARKPKEVAEVNHETFIRNALKDRMGWARKEAAPESIKTVARQMAAFLVLRDKTLAEQKAKMAAEHAAKKAAAEQAECDKLRDMIDQE
jgi:hypothetical protein